MERNAKYYGKSPQASYIHQRHCVYMGSDKQHCACGFSKRTMDSLFIDIASKNWTPNDLRNLATIINESSNK